MGTGDLNRLLQQAVEDNPPPMRMNRRAKVFFATQVAVHPPTIVIFTNSPELFDKTYLRYLENTFRDNLPFNDVAAKIHLRGKRHEDEDTPSIAVPSAATRKRAKPVKLKEQPKGKKNGGAELWDI